MRPCSRHMAPWCFPFSTLPVYIKLMQNAVKPTCSYWCILCHTLLNSQASVLPYIFCPEIHIKSPAAFCFPLCSSAFRFVPTQFRFKWIILRRIFTRYLSYINFEVYSIYSLPASILPCSAIFIQEPVFCVF